MIFRFVAEYSQSSELRREFAHDPQGVLNRYDIPESERQYLLAEDREQVARQLHAEIDEMFSVDYQALIWPVYYPSIVGHSTRQAVRSGERIEIAIAALNLAPAVKVRFHCGASQLDATILRIDHSLQTGVHNITCEAVFPESGSWDLELVNVVEGEERGDVRKNYFTISGDHFNGLYDAISSACAVIPFCDTRRAGGPEENRSVHEGLSCDRDHRRVRAAFEERNGSNGSPRLLRWPERQAQALAGSHVRRLPSGRTRVAAAA